MATAGEMATRRYRGTMTVTVCPRRPSVVDNALTTSERPPLVANGCISDATITMLSGVAFDGRVRSRAVGFAVVADPFDGRADAFPAFSRWGGGIGAAAAFFLLTAAALAVELARVAFGGFEAFRGAALGDGSDPDAVERFFAIYRWSVTASGASRRAPKTMSLPCPTPRWR